VATHAHGHPDRARQSVNRYKKSRLESWNKKKWFTYNNASCVNDLIILLPSLSPYSASLFKGLGFPTILSSSCCFLQPNCRLTSAYSSFVYVSGVSTLVKMQLYLKERFCDQNANDAPGELLAVRFARRMGEEQSDIYILESIELSLCYSQVF
jgi:hypothetical protein